MAEISEQFVIDAGSPWFAGHFPGDPILPGVAQLELVCRLLSTTFEERFSLSALRRVKFKKIIRPGDVLDIHVTSGTKKHHFAFTITCCRADVCSGTVVMRSRGD